MNRNRLTYTLILAAALNFSACGGSPQGTGGDGRAAASPPAARAASPTPAPPADANTTPGSVGEAAGAASAGEKAAGRGASSVSVSRGAGASPTAKAPTPQIGSGGNDFFLFTQARAAFNNDPELKAANVTIDVKEGVVTLSGAVASAALKSRAEQLARAAGSKGVRNQLRVSAAN